MIDATLVLLIKGSPTAEVLLGYKKTGFGNGKYSGFGGKVEPGETIIEAAVRELAEETGIVAPTSSLTQVAVLTFHFPYKPDWSQRVHVFTATQWRSYPIESNEMAPAWFKVNQVPYDKMWDDGYYWLPRVLAGEVFRADFVFKPDNATVDSVKFSPLTPSKTLS